MKTAELGVFPHAETETEGPEAECLERMGFKIGMKNPISIRNFIFYNLPTYGGSPVVYSDIVGM